MPFKKGESGNLAGKPRGAKNKVNNELRELLTAFLEQNFSKIKKDFKSLKPKDRLKFYADILPYAVPKLQSTTMELTNFDQMSEDQLNEIVNRLITAANGQEE